MSRYHIPRRGIGYGPIIAEIDCLVKSRGHEGQHTGWLWPSKERRMSDQERIQELETEIAEVKARLPKHSIPPALIIELEDLEDELEMLRARAEREPD
jgi:hypothetical protein